MRAPRPEPALRLSAAAAEAGRGDRRSAASLPEPPAAARVPLRSSHVCAMQLALSSRTRLVSHDASAEETIFSRRRGPTRPPLHSGLRTCVRLRETAHVAAKPMWKRRCRAARCMLMLPVPKTTRVRRERPVGRPTAACCCRCCAASALTRPPLRLRQHAAACRHSCLPSQLQPLRRPSRPCSSSIERRQQIQPRHRRRRSAPGAGGRLLLAALRTAAARPAASADSHHGCRSVALAWMLCCVLPAACICCCAACCSRCIASQARKLDQPAAAEGA
jgi:hypothetical protein